VWDGQLPYRQSTSVVLPSLLDRQIASVVGRERLEQQCGDELLGARMFIQSTYCHPCMSENIQHYSLGNLPVMRTGSLENAVKRS
jgi:hypothetical protein